MKETLTRTDLTDEQKQYVQQRAKDICHTMRMKGNSFFSYGGYHFWWDGPSYGSPEMTTAHGGLVDLDDLEDIWTSLIYLGYLHCDERPYRILIAEEIRGIACKHCTRVPLDPRLNDGLASTRGKGMKHITVQNYIWEWLHNTHTTMTI